MQSLLAEEKERHGSRCVEIQSLLDEENERHIAAMKEIEDRAAKEAAEAKEAADAKQAKTLAPSPVKAVKNAKKVAFSAKVVPASPVKLPKKGPAKKGVGAVKAPKAKGPAKAKTPGNAPALTAPLKKYVAKIASPMKKAPVFEEKVAKTPDVARAAPVEEKKTPVKAAKTPGAVLKKIVFEDDKTGKSPSKTPNKGVLAKGNVASKFVKQDTAPPPANVQSVVKAPSKGLAAARFAAAVQVEKLPEKKVAAVPSGGGPRKLNVKLSTRHSIQIDARALLPGTRPPKPQVVEPAAHLSEEGALEITNSAPVLEDGALRASKQRIAIKPKRVTRAKSMFVSAPIDDDWGNEIDEAESVGGEEEAAEEAVEVEPDVAALAESFPAPPQTVAPLRPKEPTIAPTKVVPAAEPVVSIKKTAATPLKIAAKPVAASTAANLDNLWDDAPAQSTAPKSEHLSGAFADIFAEKKVIKETPEPQKPVESDDIFGEGANFLTSTKSTTDFFKF
jgi:hypothetical protein